MDKENNESSLYLVVKNKITKEIQAGKYKVGDKLPPEMALCEQYKVSRTTVRIALQQLALEGRIYKIQGNGTFVSKPKIQHSLTSSSKGFAEQIIEQGYEPKTTPLSLSVIPAYSTLSKHLQINENDPVNKLIRTRSANDEPLQYEMSYIPWKLAQGLNIEECNGSLFKLLRNKYNIKIHSTIEAIEPILADKSICKFLNVPEGAPIFYLETITTGVDNVPIEYSEAYFRGDRSKFTVERIYTNL
jgi:GntR family transcriptional regulator